jgi:hypothetical protein
MNFEAFAATIDKAVAVAADLHGMYQRATPRVRRSINQALFENLFVTAGLTKKPRVVAAEVKPTLTMLARALPEHLREADEAERPELLFSTVGSNSDFLVPPAGFEPAHRAPEARALSPELRGRTAGASAGHLAS